MCLRYVALRRSLYKPLLGWLLVRCWIGFLPEYRLLGFYRLLLVRGAFSHHISLFIAVEASPFFPIVGFIFFYIGMTDEGKAWFIYIHRNVGSWIFVRVSVSSLTIPPWWRGIPFIFLWSQHDCFLVGSLILDSGHFFPSSHIDGFCLPIEDFGK